ncbi:hypothetical protein [Halovenus salina]|uniref:Uncharacterized protein n=1 Tax=Halovenus salina TaxID=1510225 RepID=A0ABD5VY05_9EURY
MNRTLIISAAKARQTLSSARIASTSKSGRLAMPDDDGTGKLDLNDAFVSPVFVISAGVDAGLLEMQIWGFDFADAFFSFSGGVR